MIDYNKTKIERALTDLYEEGLKGYKPEYRDGLNRFETIGKAIGVVTPRGTEAAFLLYEMLEDWNFHASCSVLDWIFPTLHPMTGLGADEYLSTLLHLKQKIDRESVNVYTEWNNDKEDYETARYRVEVVLTKIED